MKHKIGTVIDEDLFRRVKRRALDTRRPLSDLIQDALEQYLATAARDAGKAQVAYRVFCEQPIRLRPGHLHAVLDHDVWARMSRDKIPRGTRCVIEGRAFTRGSLRGRIP